MMGVPLYVSRDRRELFARMLDSEHMLGVLQAALPTLTDVPIQVTDCRIRVGRSRSAIRDQHIRITYRVQVAVEEGDPREFILLGSAPVGPDALDGVRTAHPRLAGHAALAPFQQLCTYLPELELALHFYPFDPRLPALAELTGAGGAALLASSLGLPEATSIVRMETELKHYKPMDRAVLRVSGVLSGADGETRLRPVYVKFFGDDRGALSYEGLCRLWAATRTATCLRVPQPLAYDSERRMLIMSEAPGGDELSEWIRCLEAGEPLPEGVGFERVRACMRAAAKSLAELQACELPLSQVRTCAQELRQIDKDRRLLQSQADVLAREAELVQRVLALSRRLNSLAPPEGSERLVPAHGGFRHKQMVGNDRCLTLIDWDGMCLANPAFDAAKFLARMHQGHALEPGRHPQMNELADTFRQTFLDSVPLATGRDLDLYEALVFAERSFRAFRRVSDGGRADAVEHIHRLANASEDLLDRVEAAP